MPNTAIPKIGLDSFDEFLINRDSSIARGREFVGTSWLFQPSQTSEFQSLLAVVGRNFNFDITRMGSSTIVYISTKLGYVR